MSNQDAALSNLQNLRVAIIGYGSQGRAHALNLRDSAVDVVVGVRAGGPSAAKARADGLTVVSPEEAARQGDIVAVLTPDMVQAELYTDVIEPNIKKGALLLFAHGFNVHFGTIKPRADLDVALVAPKGPGALVRREYEQGKGVPSLIAVHQNKSGKARDLALGYCAGIGGTRGGVIDTSFAEETETDLFGEQAVLCGGATELVMMGFETLVEAGYQPEVAYFECLHELKLIVDLLYEGGIARMHQFISDTAQYGDLTRGPRVVNEDTRARMREVLAEIRDGRFAREWVAEHKAGNKRFHELREKDMAHPIEVVGRKLRAQMSWLKTDATA